MSDEDRRSKRHRLGTRLGKVRQDQGGGGYTLSLPRLPGMVHVTHPGKAPNGSKSPGNAIRWGMG